MTEIDLVLIVSLLGHLHGATFHSFFPDHDVAVIIHAGILVAPEAADLDPVLEPLGRTGVTGRGEAGAIDISFLIKFVREFVDDRLGIGGDQIRAVIELAAAHRIPLHIQLDAPGAGGGHVGENLLMYIGRHGSIVPGDDIGSLADEIIETTIQALVEERIIHANVDGILLLPLKV